MPRTKSKAIQLRDQEIIAAARQNIPRRDIARQHGISEARVSQIVRPVLDSSNPEEDWRDWLSQGYFGDLVRLQQVSDGPGRPITSGKGDHVFDANGEPAYDMSQVNDAIRTKAQIRKNIAQLVGAEKPLPKPPETNPELLKAYEQFRETDRQNTILKEQLTEMQSRLAAIENSVPADVVD